MRRPAENENESPFDFLLIPLSTSDGLVGTDV